MSLPVIMPLIHPSLLPFFSFTLIHSYKLWMSQCSSWIQRVCRSVEEAEWRQQSSAGPWRLDMRGMLLSKLYHSVTQQDQSPQTAARLLSSPLPLFLYVPSLPTPPPPLLSDVVLFLPASSVFPFVSPCHFSLSLSVFIYFYIPLYCLSLSGLLQSKSLLPLPDTAESIHHKQCCWNTKLGSTMHYKIPLSLLSSTLTLDALAPSLSRVHVHARLSVMCVFNMQRGGDLGWR